MDVEPNKNNKNILFLFRSDNGGARGGSGGRDHAIYTYCSSSVRSSVQNNFSILTSTKYQCYYKWIIIILLDAGVCCVSWLYVDV